ncbi:fumarylacetoacetate hydrolase family protein [Streptomyces sp. NPDC020742]|uniref:2-keto-4-pentenoate hydratase n=1 Tax=unclassified Streptomyces TaxID=2593676 RepID=UPI0033CECBF0
MHKLAARLDEAARRGEVTSQPSQGAPLSVADAYTVQELSLARRLDRGERLVGVKMGFTSRQKMAQMGVDEVIWGRLTDAMLVPEGGRLPPGCCIHPRVEPEVAFLIGRDIPPGARPETITSAVTAVAPALEIIDSRYADFRFTLADVVADNASAAGFVLGAWRAVPSSLDCLGVLLEVDGRIAEAGSTASVLGDPWRSLVAAARLTGRAGMPLQAGWVVLAGGATAAVPLRPGALVRTVVESLGSASVAAAPSSPRP